MKHIKLFFSFFSFQKITFQSLILSFEHSIPFLTTSENDYYPDFAVRKYCYSRS